MLGLVMTGQDIPGLVAWELRQPPETRLTYEATCGSTRLRIEGYGNRQPDDIGPRLYLNGRLLRGVAAEALEADLSEQRAAYRLSTRCAPEGSVLTLEVHRAAPVNGGVEYRIGVSVFRGGAMLYHECLARAPETSYWFW